MSWSPDIQTIVHHSAGWQVDYMELIESLLSVDVSGNVRELIELNELMIIPYIGDWIDPTTLVMYYPIFEGTRLLGKIENTPYYISMNGDLLISSGEVVGTLSASAFEFQLPVPSPNGNWFIMYKIVRGDSGGRVTSLLMNANGEPIQEWNFECFDPV